MRFWASALNRNDVWDTGIWWRERNAAPRLSQQPLRMWRQLYQIVFSGNSPQWKKRNHWNSHPSPSPSFIALLLAQAFDTIHHHYFFLCSSARLMIRDSQGLILNFHTKKMPLWCSTPARFWVSNTFVYQCRINFNAVSLYILLFISRLDK